MNNKNILIISHNIIDASNNVGKTVISLLKGWPRKHIRSIYLRNEIRDTMLCNDSYMISDVDVVKNICTFNSIKCGNRVTISEKQNVKSGNEGAYRLGNKRYPLVSLVRDILWYKGSWKTAEFNNWINEVTPDIILFIPNDYTLAFEIAHYVRQLTGTPMITFFTDDAFYYGQRTSPIDWIRRKWLLKEGWRIVQESDGMICASDLMQREYEDIFKKKSIVLGNCVEISKMDYEKEINVPDVFTFSYIGNLHSNRWKALLEIGECIDKINRYKDQTVCMLNVYSASDLEDQIWDTLRRVRSIHIKGSIPPIEVKRIQEESDALLHIEAFDRKSKLSTRLSMSTKIFEYMARNVPVFAYGPEDISSISFLKDGKFAVVCTKPSELFEQLSFFIHDEKKRAEIKRCAYKYAKDNFEEFIVSKRFMDYAYSFLKGNRTHE